MNILTVFSGESVDDSGTADSPLTCQFVKMFKAFTLHPTKAARRLAVALLPVMFAACGGGGGGESAANTSLNLDGQAQSAGVILRQSAVAPTIYTATSDADASRFLTQATFGPSVADVTALNGKSLNAWIDSQLSAPATPTHVSIARMRESSSGGRHSFNHSFWEKALTSPDQLRQRMAFALSQIFVVSFQDNCASATGLGMNSYYDMLTAHAFGTYRELLEAVSRHPIMGCYLSHLKNQRADPKTGRVPDENYAREVMQLFSIGLVQLNEDGTVALDSSGQPIETYGAKDVTEMARVFTGWSWDCPRYPEDICFNHAPSIPRTDGKDMWTLPMLPYSKYHDSGEKQILGRTIPASADPLVSMKAALDVLAKHNNVAPFIGKQLIQRFVTSNPSPAYVKRVAQAFKNSNGNLGITLKAVLLDEEARNPLYAQSSSYGKVREPVLKLSAFLRAFGATSDSGAYLIGSTKEDAYGLGQSVLFAPSVFNFYRPNYSPPASNTSNTNLVAPELQIAHETSVAGYASFIRDVIWAGVGLKGYDGKSTRSDVTLEYFSDRNPIRALADRPAELVDLVDRRLTYGQMSSNTRSEIVNAISTIDYVSKTTPTATQITNTRMNRLYSTLLLAMVSPDFAVQK